MAPRLDRLERRRITPHWLIGFLLALLAAVALLSWSEATRKLDRLLHDGFVRLNQRAPPTDVVIAAIDPDSLAEHGRWPWPRDLQAVLVTALGQLDPAALVVDIVYLEPGEPAAADTRLADALARAAPAVLPVLLEVGFGAPGGVSAAERLPLPVFARAAAGLGHIALPIDDDGIVRRVYLKAGFRHPHWSTLALEAFELVEPGRYAIPPGPPGPAAAALPTTPVGPVPLPGRRYPLGAARPAQAGSLAGRSVAAVPGLEADGDANVDVDVWVDDHEVLIPFYGPSGTFARVSARDLLAGRVPREAIAGKVVLLGLTTPGLGDVVPTPVSAEQQPLPGVEVHANIYAALADGSLVTPAPDWFGLAIAALAVPLLIFAYSRAPPQWALAIALLGAAVPLVLSLALYTERQLWFQPFAASLPILSSYLIWSRHRLSFVNRFLEEERAKLTAFVPRRDSRENLKLAEFFEHALRHLPIEGWRFEADGERFSGGLPVIDLAPRASGGWRSVGPVHVRRYPAAGRLVVALRLRDAAPADAVLDYIDSLARIRSRIPDGRLSSSIERLQLNATRLSDELAWLRSVKQFSENVLAGSPIGFAVWNPAGEMVRGNALLHRLLPSLRPRSSLIDFLRSLGQDLESPEGRARLDALLLDTAPWQIATTVGDSELVVDLSAVGERLADRLVCASIVDVSAIRTVERARAEMVEYLSHDLRSPLISALYEVEGDAPTTPRASAAVATNIRKSLAMMDDLLHVARADNLDAASFSEVLFDAVIGNALDELLPQARARRIRLTLRACDADCWVCGDASSLQRAVGNVVHNAIKYSPDGSEVRITLDEVAAPDNEGDPGAAEAPADGYADGQVLLRVSDVGVGIDPAVIDTLFTRFRRDPGVVGSHKGTGLGLALVSRVVGQHGGSVSAASGERGTDIEIRLPLLRLPGDDA